jgi:hypothetical protein
MSKILYESKVAISIFQFRFEILNFGHWNLFDIWCLLFVISDYGKTGKDTVVSLIVRGPLPLAS